MELVLLLVQVEEGAAADTFDTERDPLIEDLPYSERHRHAADQDIEVAGEVVL